MAAVAKLELDASGYLSSMNQARDAVKQFNESESAQADALERSLDALQKSADGTKTTAQQSKILKDELDKLRQQYANLTKEQKNNKTITEAYNKAIKETEARQQSLSASLTASKKGYVAIGQTLPGLATSMATLNTATTAAGVSVGVLDKAMKLLNLSNPLGWVVIGITALKGLWDQFMKVETVADFVQRTMGRIGSVFNTVWAAVVNMDFSGLGDKVKAAWEEGAKVYDNKDLVDTIEGLNRADLDAAKTLLDETKARFQVGKATKEELNNAIKAYKDQADVFETAYKDAATTSLKRALADASGLAGAELDKLTDEFLKSTNKAKFIDEKGLGNFEQPIRKAQEEYQKYVDFHDEATKAVQEAQASITSKTNAEVAARQKAYEKEQADLEKTRKKNEEWLKQFEEWDADIDDSEAEYGRQQSSQLDANRKAEIEKQAKAEAEFKEQVDKELADKADTSSLTNKLKVGQDLVSDFSGINGSLNSLYDSLLSFEDIDNPFEFFDSIFGIASEVMNVVQTIQSLGQAMQTISAISQASAAAETAASAQKTAANTTETASEITNATAKTFNAHSAIPFVGIAIAAAMVAAMIATMIATKNKAKKFAYGGLVPGNSFSGDKVPAWVNSGELILNQNEQAVVRNLVGNGRNDRIEIYGETRLDGKDILISYKRRDRFESRR